MATEKLRAELELITAQAEKDLSRFDRKLSSVDKKVRDLGGKGGKSMRPLGEGLSAATANASEFEKSMAAANARVIAFGASAGLIIQVQRALKEAVKATMEVEKALTDINVVLNTSASSLQKFGNELFNIAGQTGQGFQTVAVAATELARQGLSVEKTLLRTKDALILTRLTGMGAEEAVSSLTAAVNSFNKSGITSSQVVNKMAKVDQAFAVSSDDLAKAISRVGSSAVDAGVSMDELLAITTAVQQRTARGGAVIGNAFKTIFTRIGRTDVQKKLAGINVATRDMTTGALLPATKVLENLADKFQHLGQTQQNQIAESVAGVFQVNILRAALGDLSSKYGVYSRALKESAGATNEAYLKNEQLNETLDALVNKSLANLTKAGSAIGGATLKPAIENVLNLVNSAIGAFGEGGKFEDFGKGLGKDLLEGMGKFLSGPGLAIITIGIGKLAINFASFAKTAIAGVLELNRGVLARKGIEDSVTAALMQQPGIIKQIERGELSAATAAKDMLAAMRAQNMEASKLAVTSRVIAANMMGTAGARTFKGGGRAQGFVPNFADADAERASAAAGGYKAGVIKTMNVPGEGSMMYNGAETVKRFPGMTQPAIMPPKKSLAGANYKSAFGAAHGFDPYAADGFVPNFDLTSGDRVDLQKSIFPSGQNAPKALRGVSLFSAVEMFHKRELSRSQLSQAYGKKTIDSTDLGKRSEVGPSGKLGPVTKGIKDRFKDAYDTKRQVGIVALSGAHRKDATAWTTVKQLKAFGPYLKRLADTEGAAAATKAGEEKITFTNMQVSSLDQLKRNAKKDKKGKSYFSALINEELIDPLANVGAKIIGSVLGNQADSVGKIKEQMQGKRLLPKSTEGELFEKAIQITLHTPKRFIASIDATDNAPFDFEEKSAPTVEFKKKLGFDPALQRADAKRTGNQGALGTLIKKSYNQAIIGQTPSIFNEGGALPQYEKMNPEDRKKAEAKLAPTVSGRGGKRGAGGFIPNFSPLGDAITRERAAGVPVSAIRVSSNPALKGPGNPGGLGVHNTIDEPAGLGQGISRSKRMGINPKTHGIPNFADMNIEAEGKNRQVYYFSDMDQYEQAKKKNPSLGLKNPTGLLLPIKASDIPSTGGKPSHTANMQQSRLPSWSPTPATPVTTPPMTTSPVATPTPKPSRSPIALTTGLPHVALPGDKRYSSGVDRPDSAKSAIPPKIVDKIDDSSNKIKAGATKFAGAIDRLMIPLTAVGYMGIPAIERKFGAQAGDTFQAGLGGVFAAQMAGGMAATGVNKLGEMIPKKPPKLNPVTGKITKLAQGAKTFGKWGKLAAPVIAAAGAGYAAFSGLKSDPADIEHQENLQRIQERMDNLKGMGSGSGVLSGTVGTIAQNFGTMTSSQVVKAHGDVGKQTDSMLEDIMASGQDVDTSEFQSAMAEFQKHMLSNATDLESAEEKASKAIQNLTENITKLQKSATGEQKAEQLSKFFRDQEDTIEGFKKYEKEGGNLTDSDTAIKIFRKHMGDMIDTGAFSDTRSGVPWLASAPTGFTSEAYSTETGVTGAIRSGDISGSLASTFDKMQNAVIDSVFSSKGLASFFNPAGYGNDAISASRTVGEWTGLWDPNAIIDERQAIMADIMSEVGHFDREEMNPVFVRRLNKAMDEILLKALTDKQKSFVGQVSKSIDITGATKVFQEKEFKGMTDEVEIQKILDKRRDELKASENPLVALKDLGVFKDEQAINKVIEHNLPKTVRMNIIDAFFKRLKASIIGYSNRPKAADDFRRTVEDFTPLAREQQSLLGAAFESKRALKHLKRTNDSAENLAKVQDDMALALARATESAEGVARVELDVSLERTKRKFDDLTEELDKQFSGQISGAKAGLLASQLKFSKQKPQRSTAAKEETAMLEKVMAGADPRFAGLPKGHPLRSKTIPLEARATKMRSLIAEAQAKGGFDSTDADAAMQLEMRQKALKIIELRIQQSDIEREYNEGRIDENERNKKMAELKDLQLRLEHEYNREATQRNLRIKASQTAGALQFVEGDLRAGKITGSSATAQRRAARQAQRDAHGLDPSKGGAGFAGFGTIVSETFDKGPRDATEQFEAGIADVAVTVRDSLKDAIKNIASGAESFEDSMANIFSALAEKIAGQGIDQGVDSMFSWLGNLGGKKNNKHGGYIPRGYNQGGVVTGGSGVKDDVMTYMQGGEYVIKKSAAQKIGYGTLSAINSYAEGGKARVSLAKEYLWEGEDRKRPTSGGFNVSKNLSMQAIFRDDDPQTDKMFGRRDRMDGYLQYRLQEERRRERIIAAVKAKKKARLTNAYISAAMRIGTGAIGANFGPTAGGAASGAEGGGIRETIASPHLIGPRRADGSFARGGSPAMVMGGEYIMSPQTTAKYGTGFMGELNRGRLPGYQDGGFVGGAAMAAGGITTNNVSLSISVGKDGKTNVDSDSKSSQDSNSEREDKEDVEKSKQFGDAIRSAVLKEIQRQQRPGGMLRDGASYAGGRRT